MFGESSPSSPDESASPYDFSAPRLYLDAPLAAGQVVPLEEAQRNYLRNVLRLSEGGTVLVFNGRDGEWRAVLTPQGRRHLALNVAERVRAQTAPGDLHYLFAPLKHARLDYMVQKAVEMGASRLRPVLTRRTQVHRVNLERMRANAIEAAEQCGILTLPDIAEPVTLATLLSAWPAERALIFCDEDAAGQPLGRAVLANGARRNSPLAVLIGPEGGFDPTERQMLLDHPSSIRLSLGPRILRADTAAVAALALIQSELGDWDVKPPS